MVLVWKPEAVRQLDRTLIYYSEIGAFLTVKRIRDEVLHISKLLPVSPYMGKEESEISGYRSIVIKKHFKLIYIIIDEEITISAFWDVRQAPEKLHATL